MKILVLSEERIRSLHEDNSLRDVMKTALISLSANSAKNHPRHVLPMGEGMLGLMVAEELVSQTMGFKAVSVFPKNSDHDLNPHQGVVMVLDQKTGQVKGLLDGSSLTGVRTAAVSAAAANVLAREESSHLALLGAGLQALEHARAFSKIRKISKISIFNRSLEKARVLAETLVKELRVEILLTESPQQAVSEADMVAAVTAAKDPIISILDLREGTHLSAVGACRPDFREVDFVSRKNLKVYVDSFSACHAEAEEILYALKNKKLLESEVLGEIGHCFQGRIAGRETKEDITVFKSVGLGIEDVAAAEFFLKSALQQGVGQEIFL